MTSLSPSKSVIDALEAASGSGPVVMVNLLKFKRGGGSKAYARYAEAFEVLLKRAGGRFLYTGRVAEAVVGEEAWDAIALVEYPSRRVFAEVIRSADYAAIAAFREDGLERTLLYATDPRS